MAQINELKAVAGISLSEAQKKMAAYAYRFERTSKREKLVTVDSYVQQMLETPIKARFEAAVEKTLDSLKDIKSRAPQMTEKDICKIFFPNLGECVSFDEALSKVRNLEF